MRRTIQATAAALALVMSLGGVAVAGTQLQIRDRDQLKDGSCVAKLQTRDRDRLKDGSCVAKAQKRTRAKDGTGSKTRTRDRLRDGSCVA